MPGLERFAGRVAILTGSSKGIGLATARRLGVEGCKVVVSSRKQGNVDDAVNELTEDGIEVSGIQCDQGSKKDRRNLIQHTLEHYGGFDCLFISAGANNHSGNLLTVNSRQFDHVFNLNVKSSFQMIQECVPHMEKRGGGAIVTNASVGMYDPLLQCMRTIMLYSIAKGTLASMTQHIAPSCYAKNIRVNAVSFGSTDTPFFKGVFEGPEADVMLKRFENVMGYNLQSQSSMASPDEAASVVSFLLSSDASFINGQCIVAAGRIPFTRSL